MCVCVCGGVEDFVASHRLVMWIVPVIASDNGLINFGSLMPVERCPAISLNGSRGVTENNEYIIVVSSIPTTRKK